MCVVQGCVSCSQACWQRTLGTERTEPVLVRHAVSAGIVSFWIHLEPKDAKPDSFDRTTLGRSLSVAKLRALQLWTQAASSIICVVANTCRR